MTNIITDNSRSQNYKNSLRADIDGDGNGSRNTKRTHSFVVRRAPRRMFLCDVPTFFDTECTTTTTTTTTTTVAINDDDLNFVRLMGTIVDMTHTSSSLPPACLQTGITPNKDGPVLENDKCFEPHEIIHFAIDDGTGVIEVFSKRSRAGGEINAKNSTTNDKTDISLDNSKNMCPNAGNHMDRNAFIQSLVCNQQQPSPNNTGILETLLASPISSISVGHTVDCIGRLQIVNDDIDEKICSSQIMLRDLDDTHNQSIHPEKRSTTTPRRILLAASSISLVRNPQEVILRQLDLSSSSRWSDDGGHTTRSSSSCYHNNNPIPIPTPKNRLLVGGYLERKLNHLYHCPQQRSVHLDVEAAFRYIKYSKDDGGITSKEIASLVGAVEPNEILAVNLTVDRLREDCRIYLNQGKWFPM